MTTAPTFPIRWGNGLHAISGTEAEIRWFIDVNRKRDRPERPCVTSRKRADEIEATLDELVGTNAFG